MNNLKHNIKHIMHQELDYQNIPSNFEGLWEEYTMKSNKPRRKKLYKALILAATITSISVTTIGAVQRMRMDNINIPFQTDEAILGTWESVDFVDNIKDFNLDQPTSSKEDLYLHQLTFNKDSSVNFKIRTDEGITSPYCVFTWTKGFILDPVDITASKYIIKEINNEQYMFMEWKSGDYSFWRINNPYYYVLKKVNNN